MIRTLQLYGMIVSYVCFVDRFDRSVVRSSRYESLSYICRYFMGSYHTYVSYIIYMIYHIIAYVPRTYHSPNVSLQYDEQQHNNNKI